MILSPISTLSRKFDTLVANNRVEISVAEGLPTEYWRFNVLHVNLIMCLLCGRSVETCSRVKLRSSDAFRSNRIESSFKSFCLL